MRTSRILVVGAKYHVIARTARKDLLLESDVVKDMFLDVVVRAKAKYDFRIENFCILGNHFHFIIQPLGASNLSEIMKWILGVFAQKYNRVYKSWGHFWGDRFFSRPIANFLEYIRVFEYIDYNPVKANLVVQADDWRYGGLWHLRRGIRKIVDIVPEWISFLRPGHRSMLLS